MFHPFDTPNGASVDQWLYIPSPRIHADPTGRTLLTFMSTAYPVFPSGYGIDHPIALLSQHIDWSFAAVPITITVSLASFIRRIYYVETSTASPHLAALEWPQNMAPVDDQIYIMRSGDTFIGQLWAQEGRRIAFGRHRALTHFLGFIPQRNVDCLSTPHNWGTRHASIHFPRDAYQS